MKLEELRTLSLRDLDKELLALLKAQFGLRMQKSTQQLTNTNQLRNVRRDIARVKTIITELAGQK